ncbi:MAG: GNAT family N-acetyltransferase [Pseudomonadota bacterium]
MSEIVIPDGMMRATRQHRRRITDITCEAFLNDPVSRWLFPDARAQRAIFGRLATDVYLPRGEVHLIGDEAATMWGPPGMDRDMGFVSLLRMMVSVARYGGLSGARRGKAMGDAMDAVHPAEPHWYLFTIGTRLSARGKGLGRRLFAPVLAHCDREGIPAYLENSNPDNHGFYTSHGFEPRGVPIILSPGAPPLTPMWRVPQAGRL